MQEEVSYKENPIDEKVNDLLRAWGARQSSRRGFLTKISKVAFGTVVGASISLGLPMGGSLLRNAEAACDCNTAGQFCAQFGIPICCSGNCGGGIGTCPAGTAYSGSYFWQGCCNGSKYSYYDCCRSGGSACVGTICSNKGNMTYDHHDPPGCPPGYSNKMCTIAVYQGTC